MEERCIGIGSSGSCVRMLIFLTKIIWQAHRLVYFGCLCFVLKMLKGNQNIFMFCFNLITMWSIRLTPSVTHLTQFIHKCMLPLNKFPNKFHAINCTSKISHSISFVIVWTRLSTKYRRLFWQVVSEVTFIIILGI